MNLLQLPPEILLCVLEYLSPHNLVLCQLTNRQLRTLIHNSVVLQYNMALAVARAEDNPYSSAPLSKKLEHLRVSEDAWSMLKPKFKVEILVPVPHQTSGIYDLTGGAYLLGSIDQRAIHYIKLPRKLDDDTSWRHQRELTEPASYGIELTLREFSSGQRHPQAKEERILVMTSLFKKPAISIEIVGDHIFLILTFHDYPEKPDDQVFIYEWWSSILKAVHLTFPISTAILTSPELFHAMPHVQGTHLPLRIPCPTPKHPHELLRDLMHPVEANSRYTNAHSETFPANSQRRPLISQRLMLSRAQSHRNIIAHR
ncbi:unnamed protein product [Cyclocybe aegerita]|uniref:F-box domain-containing protein n=1 Tax=Cyclocybe aegerita TaxID=1973307 RepID=A0A8S0XNE9_CYCAE|nr:unnamed protein product [Cyclocybe aegerita]